MDLIEPFSPSMEGIAKSGETLRQIERRNNARIGTSQTGQQEIDNRYEKCQVQRLPFTRLLALPARHSFYDQNAVEQEEQRSKEDDKAWRSN